MLATTRLFPNAADPSAAAFNRQQFAALGRLCDLDVLAVIPWFPGARHFARRSLAGRYADVPASETIAGLAVRHPRVAYLPRIGHGLAPAFYLASLLPHVWRLRGRIDVVLGSWAFPDGVAAVALGALLGAPVVVKVHGSDINVIAERRALRWLLVAALPCAARVVAVSRPLADKVVALGVRRDRVVVVPNGVDRALFHPRDRAAARAALGEPPSEPLVLYVGGFEREKGILELLEAFETLAGGDPRWRLALVGGGPEEARCRALARRLPGRVTVRGARPLEDVALWMGACDLLALPSWNEGTPNVVLEALASGRRVVATRVGGIPDVLSAPALGELVEPRSPYDLARALGRVAADPGDPTEIARAAPHDWSDSAAHLFAVLETACAVRASGSGRRAVPGPAALRSR